jgi:glucose-6-phosphate 1-epimerase
MRRRPHAFKVVYTIKLDGDQLRTDMRVNNTGHEPFQFNASLHSYFGVADIETAAVQGLQGLEYLDRVGRGQAGGCGRRASMVYSF